TSPPVSDLVHTGRWLKYVLPLILTTEGWLKPCTLKRGRKQADHGRRRDGSFGKTEPSPHRSHHGDRLERSAVGTAQEGYSWHPSQAGIGKDEETEPVCSTAGSTR